MQKHALEHNKKIFWCFFGQNLFAGKLTKERLDGLTDLLTGIPNGWPDSMSATRTTIFGFLLKPLVVEVLQRCYRLGGSTGALVETESPRVPTQGNQTQMWFLALSESPEARQFVYSAESLAKLEELSDARAWVLWLKEYFKTIEDQTKAFLGARGLARAQASPQPGTRNKWKIRIRIINQSHQVNPRVLTAWNKASDWIK